MFLFKKWKPFVHPFYNLKKQSDPWLTNLGCQQRFCEIDDLTCENRFFRQFVLVWISRRNGKIEDLTITPPWFAAVKISETGRPGPDLFDFKSKGYAAT